MTEQIFFFLLFFPSFGMTMVSGYFVSHKISNQSTGHLTNTDPILTLQAWKGTTQVLFQLEKEDLSSPSGEHLRVTRYSQYHLTRIKCTNMVTFQNQSPEVECTGRAALVNVWIESQNLPGNQASISTLPRRQSRQIIMLR